MPGPPANNATEQELYTRMSVALNQTGRPVLFSLCQWGEDDVWKWGGSISQMFRIQEDHLPFWSLRPSTISAAYSHPDPDFLMTLYHPTMDFTASRTEFSFWCMWSSPLMVSTDLRNLTAQKRSILTNVEAIAINQASERQRDHTERATHAAAHAAAPRTIPRIQ
jgi:alpha-galactosidase